MTAVPVAFDRNWRWIAWLILGIGGLIVAGGLALGWGSLRHVLYAERAAGEVIDIWRDGDIYAPVVRFRLPSGEAREVRDLGSGAPDFARGDRITILYMPQNPGDFRLATFSRLWLSAIFVTAFGSCWLLFGAVAWALSRNVELFVVGEAAFAAIALAAMVFAAFAIWSAVGLLTGDARGEGTVLEIRASRSVEQEEVRRSDGTMRTREVPRIILTPIVRFTTNGGREIEFLGRGGSGASYVGGERVTVIYDPGNPIDARILSFLDLWLPATVCLVVVVVFGGSAALSRWARRRGVAPQGIS